MNVEAVARMCHELNREYCLSIDDASQVPWMDAPDWQKESAINGVQFHLDNPDAGPQASHESWMYEKGRAGWVYGEVKDEEAKTHPCIRRFADLPLEQQAKDKLFLGVVNAVRELIQ